MDSPFKRLAFFIKPVWIYLAMKYDYKTLYQKNADFFNKRKTAKKLLLASNLFLTCVFFIVYFVLLWQAIAKDFLAEELLFILGAPALCFFVATVLRIAVDRPRPYDEAGANIQPLLRKKSKDKKSFPSRHLACSFVLAAVVLEFWTGAGICSRGIRCLKIASAGRIFRREISVKCALPCVSFPR